MRKQCWADVVDSSQEQVDSPTRLPGPAPSPPNLSQVSSPEPSQLFAATPDSYDGGSQLPSPLLRFNALSLACTPPEGHSLGSGERQAGLTAPDTLQVAASPLTLFPQTPFSDMQSPSQPLPPVAEDEPLWEPRTRPESLPQAGSPVVVWPPTPFSEAPASSQPLPAVEEEPEDRLCNRSSAASPTPLWPPTPFSEVHSPVQPAREPEQRLAGHGAQWDCWRSPSHSPIWPATPFSEMPSPAAPLPPPTPAAGAQASADPIEDPSSQEQDVPAPLASPPPTQRSPVSPPLTQLEPAQPLNFSYFSCPVPPAQHTQGSSSGGTQTQQSTGTQGSSTVSTDTPAPGTPTERPHYCIHNLFGAAKPSVKAVSATPVRERAGQRKRNMPAVTPPTEAKRRRPKPLTVGVDRPVTEEDRARRQQHRVAGVCAVKGKQEYVRFKEMRDTGTLPVMLDEPLTPDPYDESMSKRTWEATMMNWRKSLHCFAAAGDRQHAW